MNRTIKYALVVLTILALIILIPIIRFQLRSWEVRTELYSIAERFGYSDQMEIVQSFYCFDPSMWIPPSAECRLFLAYRSTATLEEFQLVLEEKIGKRFDEDSSPFQLFSKINWASDHTLTVDGYDGLGGQTGF